MNFDNFYVLVDLEKKLIIDKVQELPKNWNNIFSLSGLSQEELEDLSWSGNTNCGWINMKSEKIKEYKSTPENLQLNKSTLKDLVSDKIKLKRTEQILYKGIYFRCDQKTINSLLLKKTSSIYNQDSVISYKVEDNYYSLTISDIHIICDMMERHIQDCFEYERKIFDQIDSFKSVSEFFNLNYDI